MFDQLLQVVFNAVALILGLLMMFACMAPFILAFIELFGGTT